MLGFFGSGFLRSSVARGAVPSLECRFASRPNLAGGNSLITTTRMWQRNRNKVVPRQIKEAPFARERESHAVVWRTTRRDARVSKEFETRFRSTYSFPLPPFFPSTLGVRGNMCYVRTYVPPPGLNPANWPSLQSTVWVFCLRYSLAGYRKCTFLFFFLPL